MRKVTIWIFLVLAGSVIGGVVYLRAQQTASATLGQLTATPPNFVYKIPTTLTFSIRIDTATPPTRVDLQRFDYPSGTPMATVRPRVVAQLHDDGESGDALPSDKVFTATAQFNEPATGRLYFRAVAIFPNGSQAFSGRIFVDVDSSVLPPDPGDVGKQTLEGIDSDNDGVRDDVQRWIASNYPDETLIEPLRLYAASQQSLVVNGGDETTTLQLAALRRRRAACWDFVSPSDHRRALKEIEAQVINTPQRLQAYLTNDRLLGGHTFLLVAPSAAACQP
jgi:hypothetical protein